MILDADVELAARQFGVDPALIQAVVNAEGNILKAVQCSLPSVATRAQALDVLCRSCAHAQGDFIKAGGNDRRDAFIEFWSARWAPTDAANDPNHLNVNWAPNVERLWAGMAPASAASTAVTSVTDPHGPA